MASFVFNILVQFLTSLQLQPPFQVENQEKIWLMAFVRQQSDRTMCVVFRN